MRRQLKFFALVAFVTGVLGTLGPSNTKKGKQKTSPEIKMNEGPVEKNVFERLLVEQEPLASSIISEGKTYFKDTSVKNFNGTVLGYVTPV